MSSTFSHDSGRLHRLLSRVTGGLWLAMAAFVLLTYLGGAGVGIDATRTLVPWLLASLLAAVAMFAVGTWRPMLFLSGVAGLASTAYALSTRAGSTPDFQGLSVQLAVVSLLVAMYSFSVFAVRSSSADVGRL